MNEKDDKAPWGESLPPWGGTEHEIEKLKAVFTLNAMQPKNLPAHRELTDWAQNFAMIISSYCPSSPEKNRALERLQEALMWANEAIARHPK